MKCSEYLAIGSTESLQHDHNYDQQAKDILFRNRLQCLSFLVSIRLGLCLGTLMSGHLFVKVLQPGDGEGPFRSSSQAATCYYQSNHSNVEAIPLKSPYKQIEKAFEVKIRTVFALKYGSRKV